MFILNKASKETLLETVEQKVILCNYKIKEKRVGTEYILKCRWHGVPTLKDEYSRCMCSCELLRLCRMEMKNERRGV